jgi:Trypsin-like peptidase domain
MMASLAPPDRLLAVSGEGHLPSTAQWSAIEACPRIVSKLPVEAYATGVLVAFREDHAYILSAQHASTGSVRRFQFFTEQSMPEPAVEITSVADVVMTDKTADVVMYKLPWPQKSIWKPSPLPLAKPGERPKRFPFEALSVGCSEGRLPSAMNETIRAKRLASKTETEIAFFWESASAPKPGRSGGPLLNAQGQVVGLCAANKDGLGYYAHLDEVLVALKASGHDWLWKK